MLCTLSLMCFIVCVHMRARVTLGVGLPLAIKQGDPSRRGFAIYTARNAQAAANLLSPSQY